MPTSKALRQWLASLRELAAGGRRPGLRLERALRTGRRRSSAPSRARLPAALAAAPRRRIGASGGRAWLDAAAAGGGGDRGRARRARASRPSRASTPPWRACTPTATSSTRRPRCRSATRRRSFRPASAQVRFLCNRGANGIDGLISSGIGAAAASGRPTWIVTGDLGLHHDMNGLAALRHASGPVRIVVLNNDGGGIFEFLPQAEQLERDEFEALLGTPLGLDPARVAAVYGLPHVRVERLDQLGRRRRRRDGADRDPGRPPAKRGASPSGSPSGSARRSAPGDACVKARVSPLANRVRAGGVLCASLAVLVTIVPAAGGTASRGSARLWAHAATTGNDSERVATIPITRHAAPKAPGRDVTAAAQAARASPRRSSSGERRGAGDDNLRGSKGPLHRAPLPLHPSRRREDRPRLRRP